MAGKGSDHPTVVGGWFSGKPSEVAKLQPYILVQAKETGKELRRRPYAVEVEIEYRGLRCVGKKVILEGEDDSEFSRRFAEYCSVQHRVRHPHILHFMGVSSSDVGFSRPLIITELLNVVLSDALQKYGSAFPEDVSYGVLEDVSVALRYLHERTPAIAHCGLSASSVLLTQDARAKLADVGMIDLLGLSPLRMTQKSPSVFAYMPTEAVQPQVNPLDRPRVDSFSYGVLVLHIFTGTLPTPNSSQPSPRSTTEFEIELRRSYLDEMQEHPLLSLVHQCLSDDPKSRPDMASIQDVVSRFVQVHVQDHGDRIEMTHQLAAIEKEKDAIASNVQDITTSLSQKEAEERSQQKILHLYRQGSLSVVEQHRAESKMLQEENMRLKGVLEAKLAHARDKERGAETSIVNEVEVMAGTQLEKGGDICARATHEMSEHDSQRFEREDKIYCDDLIKVEEQFKAELEVLRREQAAKVKERDDELKQVQQNENHVEETFKHQLAHVKARADEIANRVSGVDVSLRVQDPTYQQFASSQDQIMKAQLHKDEQNHLEQSKDRTRKCKDKVNRLDEQIEDKYDQAVAKSQEDLDKLIKSLNQELDAKRDSMEQKDRKIEEQEAALQQKTAVLKGLHEQFSHLQKTVTARHEVHPLSMHAKLAWTRCSPLPTSMAQLHVVVIDGEVYAGGGETESDDTNCRLFKYVPSRDVWSWYDCPVRYFGLGELSGTPALIGGVSRMTEEVTGTVHCMSANSVASGVCEPDLAASVSTVRQSEHEIFRSSVPPMPTARSHVCVVSLESCLIACGGSRGKTLFTTVEVLKKDTEQWHKADPLSIPLSHMHSTTLGDTCFLIGGRKHFLGKLRDSVSTRMVMCTLVSALLKKAIPYNQTGEPDPKATVWKAFQETQFKNSAPLSVSGMLFAIGGDSIDLAAHLTKASSKDIKLAVNAFCPINKAWVHIADLPASITMCAAVTLPSGELLVIGGKDSNQKFSDNVYKGTIHSALI